MDRIKDLTKLRNSKKLFKNYESDPEEPGYVIYQYPGDNYEAAFYIRESDKGYYLWISV
jgi:hypothetical protein